ncbi:TNF receptor-associated factor family protein DDB_G0277243-like [Bolinopsis microptera]|uniref:TNF receptor-associated factor family protein DDB_G0277243-like n=1 Tax=Bolinopsis microptera TaxID=2820187 RepID=UPI00307AA2E3
MTCFKCSILLCNDCLPSVSCCPQCKAAPVTEVFTPNSFVSKHIKTIKVECTLCSWTGDFYDFRQAHAEHCEEVLVRCKHKDCSQKCKRSTITDHESGCQHYIVRCQFCDTTIQFNDLQEHQSACEECQLCAQCKQYQLRSSMALHTHPNVGWCTAVNLACIYSDCSYEGSHHSLASHYLTEHELGLEELVKTVLI